MTRLTSVDMGPILMGSNWVRAFLAGGCPPPDEPPDSLAVRFVAILALQHNNIHGVTRDWEGGGLCDIVALLLEMVYYR